MEGRDLMEPTSEEYLTLREYLLGRLTPEGGAPLEERLLGDPAFHEEVSAAEDELVDLYLAGGLDDAERSAFETHFLVADERRRKLRFARGLRRFVADAAPALAAADRAEPGGEAEGAEPPLGAVRNPFRLFVARRPALAYALAFALLVAVAAVSWRVATRRPDAPGPGRAYAVTLAPGLTRGAGETQRITIPPDADTLRLSLEPPPEVYASYRVELQTAAGRAVQTIDGLVPRETDGRRAIEADIPARTLTPDDYQVRLAGLNPGRDAEPLARYYFRLTGR